MGKYFGTDGIRGPVGGPRINPDFVKRVGYGYARYLQERGLGDRPVLLGRDPRPSGAWLLPAVAEGLRVAGIAAYDAGIVPTPALAGAVVARDAGGGVMVTASHNPVADNGIKFFDRGGIKFTADEELRMEAAIDAVTPADAKSENGPVAVPVSEAILPGYIHTLASLLDKDALKGLRIGLDTANGATRRASLEVLQLLGAEVTHLGNHTDGNRINDGCGSEHIDLLAATVAREGLDIGLAHDGDGDRLVCVDETGRRVDGDQLMALIALDGLKRGWLSGGRLVTTIQSNLGLDAAVSRAGGTVERVAIGDRNVAEKMRTVGAAFGGENSGHLIFSRDATTGDGLLAALRILEILRLDPRPFSNKLQAIPLYPQRTRGLSVSEKRPLEACVALDAAMREWERRLEGAGRILVRYSGTEAKLRLLAEAESAELADAAMEALVTASQKDLNVQG